MAHYTLKTHFDAPIENVWEVVIDLPHMPQWHVAITEVKDTSGPFDHVGATATVIVKGPDRLHECREEVTAAEPPRLRSDLGREVGGGMEWTSTVRYTPADGGTDCEWELEMKPPSGLMGAFADKLFMQRMIERQMHQSVDNLKEIVRAKALQPV
jgi:uncharacterized membrane protein